MLFAPPNVAGPSVTHVAAAENSRCAVQRVVEEVRRTLQTPLVIFTIASRPDVWRATAPLHGKRGTTIHETVTWQAEEHIHVQPCEGTLAWLSAENTGQSSVGEGLMGLLRMAVRLFVCQHAPAQPQDEGCAPAIKDDAHTDGEQQFVHVAAHALRSPIMTLRMQIESLDRALGAPSSQHTAHKLARHMRRAIGQCDALVGLSDNLLDVCTLQHEPLQLTVAEIDLTRVVRAVGQRFERHAAHAGCVLLIDMPEPVVGRWDHRYLERAIANLVDNAIRYAPGTPITLGTQALEDGGHATVQDSGLGIADENVVRLFERG